MRSPQRPATAGLHRLADSRALVEALSTAFTRQLSPVLDRSDLLKQASCGLGVLGPQVVTS